VHSLPLGLNLPKAIIQENILLATKEILGKRKGVSKGKGLKKLLIQYLRRKGCS
jgi:hypothetical protein